jgi:GNAT superfamily N-acetyltransferase
VIEIRPGSAADAPAITRVRRESWHAAYEGIIAASVIARATAAGGAAADPPPYRRTLVAEAGEHPAVVGYASFGPERTVAPASLSPRHAAGGRPPRRAPGPQSLTPDSLTPDSLTPDSLTPDGQLYALYVTPAWWSAGAGRALMERVLTALGAESYRRAVLWVLADNARARRFYERAGFALDGAANTLAGLGGVLEVRYSRDLTDLAR